MDKARQKKIQELLNYKLFKIKPKSNLSFEIYDQALTHSSYARELLDKNLTSVNNERLEFLGNFLFLHVMGSLNLFLDTSFGVNWSSFYGLQETLMTERQISIVHSLIQFRGQTKKWCLLPLHNSVDCTSRDKQHKAL